MHAILKFGIIGLVVILCAALPTQARSEGSSVLFVSPNRLLIPSADKITEINVSNKSDVARRYDIEVVDQAMNDDGLTQRVETFEYSAKRMLRFVPKRFTLQPGERQTVRIMAQRPSDLADGDYHSHMLFREVPLSDLDKADLATERGTEKSAQFEVRALYGVAVPVIVQHGKIEAEMNLGAVNYIPASDGAPAHLAVELTRTGNAEASGHLKIEFQKEGSPAIALITGQWIPIYREQPKIARRIPLTALPNGESLSGGIVTLTLTRDQPPEGTDPVIVKTVRF